MDGQNTGQRPASVRGVTNVAVDAAQGMTFGDLTRFIQDGLHADLGPGAQVRVRVGFRGQIKRIEATDR